ncbi:unnamed protein product [Phaedon cochleariae]|uniref:RNA helicase n=1 Tax=Phaedon cochleariae TaxID=80249 RepID=A0A9P0DS95_PHACE|nr:unnamed protein product [Phaedon cochleariae]
MSHILAHSLEENARTKDVTISENVNFESLLLSEDIFQGLCQTGFRKPSPIQLKAIPVGRCGFDLIVKSKSGTGKTLVFSIIALENIDRHKQALQALILAPTREIAVQIQDVIKKVGSNIEGLIVESFIGGLSFEDDKKKCKQCQIAVGTPGRIKHLISEGILTCDSTRLFVLDETDKLMDASFRNDINQIYNALPAKKQIITTSATYPNELQHFLAQYMQSPTYVNAELETPLLLGLKQFVSVLKPHANVVQQMKLKNEELLNILSNISFTQCLVFSNYQTRAESISNYLNQKGWTSMFISAAQNQSQRLKALNSLKDFKCRIMLSTDLTARGIDAAKVDLVINYDIPVDAMTYLHRMGRAGRYGAQGVCLNLAFGGQELEKLRGILGQIGGTALGIPKLPKFKGHISDLVKINTPSEEQIFGKLDESHIDLTLDKNKIYELTKNSAANAKLEHNENHDILESQKIMSTLNDNKTDSGEVEKQSFEMDTKVVSASMSNDNIVENNESDVMGILNDKSEMADIKNLIADMNPQAILASLANQNFNMNTAAIEHSNEKNTESSHMDKCNKKVQNDLLDKRFTVNDTLMALLGPKRGENTPSEMKTVNIVSEEDKRQQLFTKNKALLDVVRLLDSPSQSKTNVNGSSVEQYLNILKEQDKEKLSEMSEKPIPDILNSLQNDELEKENVPAEVEIINLENIFKLGYDCIVKSNNTSWRQILETVEEHQTRSSKEDTMDELGDDEYESMEEYQECEEMEIMKWVPVSKTHKPPTASKNLLEEASDDGEVVTAENKDGELTKWQPASSATKELQQTCLSESVSEEINRYDHYSSCFEECNQQLWQNGLSFDNMNSFDEWFYYEWEAQLYAMRNYVQQNIYVQEMSRYQHSKTNK